MASSFLTSWLPQSLAAPSSEGCKSADTTLESQTKELEGEDAVHVRRLDLEETGHPRVVEITVT